jgi:hypothetical protein
VLAPVLSTIHPVKCWDFAKRRRFPVRFPQFSAIFPDFSEEQHSRGGLYCFTRERFSAEEKRELEWREADERFEKRMQEQYEKTNAIIGRLGNRIGDFVEGFGASGADAAL